MPETDPQFTSFLRPVLCKIELPLGEAQIFQLCSHYRLLQRWNRRINLTAIRDPEEIAERHFGESLFAAKTIGPCKSLVDVGSGAGFPGIPFAVVRPQVDVTLIESIAKKVSFLKEVTRPLANVTVSHGRVEELQGRFDWSIVRAVSPGRVLPHLKRISSWVALLVTLPDAEKLKQCSGISWEGEHVLPWSREKVLLQGRVRDGAGACST